jgi:hypothetical protein
MRKRFARDDVEFLILLINSTRRMTAKEKT